MITKIKDTAVLLYNLLVLAGIKVRLDETMRNVLRDVFFCVKKRNASRTCTVTNKLC